MLVIVQARSSSKRFKNKIFHPIFGKPLIEHVIKKIKKSKKIKIIVSTSINKEDDNLVSFLKKKKIKFYRGSLNNVAKRLYETAVKEKKKYFIRVSGDSPLIDFRIINKIIEVYRNEKNFDLYTNLFPRTFPKGQSVEIIKTEILGENIKFFTQFEKEHVTKYFYKNSKKFKIKNLKNEKKIQKLKKLSIDNQKELKKLLKDFKKEKFLNYSYLNEKN